MHEANPEELCLQVEHFGDMLVYSKGKLQWVEIVRCEGYPVLVMGVVIPHY